LGRATTAIVFTPRFSARGFEMIIGTE